MVASIIFLFETSKSVFQIKGVSESRTKVILGISNIFSPDTVAVSCKFLSQSTALAHVSQRFVRKHL